MQPSSLSSLAFASRRSYKDYARPADVCVQQRIVPAVTWQAFRSQLLFFAVSEMSIIDPMCAGGCRGRAQYSSCVWEIKSGGGMAGRVFL